LSREWTSVDLYSISACFGFYSQGMRVFSDALKAMRRALTNPEPFRTETMRLLLVADDNPVDLFGVERFHQYLEPCGLRIRRLEKPHEPDRWIQFAIFRSDADATVLYTRPQGGVRDDALELGVNRLADAIEIGTVDDAARIGSYTDLFESAW